jgi:hypothetical protein
VVVVVVGAVLMKDVAVVGCENIVVVATGWSPNIDGVDVFVFVWKSLKKSKNYLSISLLLNTY